MMDIAAKVERQVALIDGQQTVLDAAQLMAERFIGSVVVMAASEVQGIFTERDLLRIVAQQQNPATVKLKDVMRTDLVSVSPQEQVDRCLELMKQHRCRHLAVFEGGSLVGIVSLRDLAALMLEEKEELISQLTRYITG